MLVHELINDSNQCVSNVYNVLGYVTIANTTTITNKSKFNIFLFSAHWTLPTPLLADKQPVK